ncbi:hypothetical protein CC85DRAFT_315775 [Cutaneotrichosporon oleaginosum]|uniref:NTF2-domain-containing protein n=1 Tax=Cutaneotrichosporon oleaginosum TaxID=879819 RepID=A0A0J0XBR0_9TREE|nr:uncharacterized protein CC85DRAFT_315775 [Cutaneotrichosporon oleaginosum]KLT38496.1 hypothetical protein CC85DRAFT_315775 [Cutaneotrichosporon oleaginosum]TXT12568.1 hypothetical protein COLE_02978 [Cutaneotrichosporon oleaginosum]
MSAPAAVNGHASTSTEQAPAASSSIPVPSSAASQIQPSDVGWQFVPQYYNFVNKQPHRLHCFYNKRSTFLHGEEGEDTAVAFGQAEIHERITKIGYDQCKVYINSIDSQSSANGGVIIQVLGEMSNANKPWRKFAQTFFLAEQPNGYFVLNDIFRYLKEETDEDEEPEVDDAPVVSSAPGTQADAAHAQQVPTAPVAIEQEPEEEPAQPEPAAPEPSEEKATEPEVAAPVAKEEEKPEEKVVEPTPAAAEEPAPPAPEPVAEETKPEPAAPVVAAPAAAPASEKAATPANGSAAASGTVTPAAQPPAAAAAPAPAAPVAPAKPAAPKSWASLAAGGAKAWSAVTAPAAAAPKKAEPVPAPAAPAPAPAAPAPAVAAAPAPTAAQKASPQYEQAMAVKTAHCFVKLPNWSTGGDAAAETIDEATLRGIASRFGEVSKVEIVKGKACAFVEFTKVESARKAIVASLTPNQGGEGGVVHGEGKLNFETRKEKDERSKFRRGGAPDTGNRGGGQPRTNNSERGGAAGRGGRGRPRGGASGQAK